MRVSSRTMRGRGLVGLAVAVPLTLAMGVGAAAAPPDVALAVAPARPLRALPVAAHAQPWTVAAHASPLAVPGLERRGLVATAPARPADVCQHHERVPRRAAGRSVPRGPGRL